MSLEVFVRAVGAAMGVARDSFGAAATGQTLPAASAAAAPQIATPGTGQALGAFETESSRLTTHATTLAEQDASTHAQLSHAVAAATAGRARMEGIIGAASASVHALAPATATPQGQQALVTALTRICTALSRRCRTVSPTPALGRPARRPLPPTITRWAHCCPISRRRG